MFSDWPGIVCEFFLHPRENFIAQVTSHGPRLTSIKYPASKINHPPPFCQPEREKARSHLTMFRFPTCRPTEREKARSHLTIRSQHLTW
jgi:hypothetical protein